MIVVKNQIRDITAYLEEADVKRLEKFPLEARIFEPGRTKWSVKRLRIWVNGNYNHGYVGKNKNPHTTLYKVSMSLKDYEDFMKNGQILAKIPVSVVEAEGKKAENSSREYVPERQDVRIEYVGKMSSYYHEKYEECKKSIRQAAKKAAEKAAEQITSSQSQRLLSYNRDPASQT